MNDTAISQTTISAGQLALLDGLEHQLVLAVRTIYELRQLIQEASESAQTPPALPELGHAGQSG